MARIQPIDLANLPEPHLAAYEAAMAGRSGPRINIHGTVGHSPAVLVAFVNLANQLRNATLVEPRLRELAIVTVSCLKGASYEFGKHWNLALSVGVDRAQLEAIESLAATPPAPLNDVVARPCFDDDVAAAVVRLAAEAATNVRIADATWAAAARHLDERQLVELLMNIGMYCMTAQLTEAVEMDVEDWFQRR